MLGHLVKSIVTLIVAMPAVAALSFFIVFDVTKGIIIVVSAVAILALRDYGRRSRECP